MNDDDGIMWNGKKMGKGLWVQLPDEVHEKIYRRWEKWMSLTEEERMKRRMEILTRAVSTLREALSEMVADANIKEANKIINNK